MFNLYFSRFGTDLEYLPKGVGMDALQRQGVLAVEADALTGHEELL